MTFYSVSILKNKLKCSHLEEESASFDKHIKACIEDNLGKTWNQKF